MAAVQEEEDVSVPAQCEAKTVAAFPVSKLDRIIRCERPAGHPESHMHGDSYQMVWTNMEWELSQQEEEE